MRGRPSIMKSDELIQKVLKYKDMIVTAEGTITPKYDEIWKTISKELGRRMSYSSIYIYVTRNKYKLKDKLMNHSSSATSRNVTENVLEETHLQATSFMTTAFDDLENDDDNSSVDRRHQDDNIRDSDCPNTAVNFDLELDTPGKGQGALQKEFNVYIREENMNNYDKNVKTISDSETDETVQTDFDLYRQTETPYINNRFNDISDNMMLETSYGFSKSPVGYRKVHPHLDGWSKDNVKLRKIDPLMDEFQQLQLEIENEKNQMTKKMQILLQAESYRINISRARTQHVLDNAKNELTGLQMQNKSLKEKNTVLAKFLKQVQEKHAVEMKNMQSQIDVLTDKLNVKETSLSRTQIERCSKSARGSHGGEG
ncbi:uncharacterized protein [Anoplolepis gracilipes]|uniref:uncharacterized protein n=1 Tax=Anoplolepis gracilipes TaxID=354296 RepID=UPI003B9F677F